MCVSRALRASFERCVRHSNNVFCVIMESLSINANKPLSQCHLRVHVIASIINNNVRLTLFLL